MKFNRCFCNIVERWLSKDVIFTWAFAVVIAATAATTKMHPGWLALYSLIVLAILGSISLLPERCLFFNRFWIVPEMFSVIFGTAFVVFGMSFLWLVFVLVKGTG